MKKILIACVCVVGLLGGLNKAYAQTTTTTTTSTSTSSTTSTSTSSTTSTTTSTTLICSDGSLPCDRQCNASGPNSAVCAGGHSGLNFSGVCVAGANSTAVCKYLHCGSASQICVGGPWTTIGCSSDGACASGEACVSSLGKAGCGTGYSQCVKVCTQP